MGEATHLRKLAGRAPERSRGDVRSFVLRNIEFIRRARDEGHGWPAIYAAARDDGCPSRSSQYFAELAEEFLEKAPAKSSESRSQGRKSDLNSPTEVGVSRSKPLHASQFLPERSPTSSSHGGVVTQDSEPKRNSWDSIPIADRAQGLTDVS